MWPIVPLRLKNKCLSTIHRKTPLHFIWTQTNISSMSNEPMPFNLTQYLLNILDVNTCFSAVIDKINKD